jgi:hypothetical protein
MTALFHHHRNEQQFNAYSETCGKVFFFRIHYRKVRLGVHASS